jgi:hypothetical protein
MCHWYADSAYIYTCGHPITDLDEREYQVGLKVCDRKEAQGPRNPDRVSKTSPAHRPIPRRRPRLEEIHAAKEACQFCLPEADFGVALHQPAEAVRL